MTALTHSKAHAAGDLASECKIDVQNPTIYLTGVCELIPCTLKSKESINA